MDLALKDLGEYVAAALPNEILGATTTNDELAFAIHRHAVFKVLKFLRDDANCQFKQLMDICGADYPGRENRFDVIYNLLSLVHNVRARVKLATDETTPVPSVTGLFSSAAWWEREAWDMYGIAFAEDRKSVV